ncbi:MAG TPA: PAS domain-containing protein, partial [Verrucomicrobiota bacterium]|nr:PAS domain-containing protein [Verrucomicrobiota bacterium]
MNTETTQILLLIGDSVANDPFAEAGPTADLTGFEFHPCRRLSEALKLLGNSRYDAICSRLNLPDSQGLPTLMRLREAARGVPVVVLLSATDQSMRPDAIINGATDCVVETGSPVERLACVVHHLLERQRAEERLREQEAFFWLVSENVTDLIAVIDRDGRRLYNSPSYRQLVNDVGMMCGTDSFREVHPDDVGRIRRVFQETVDTGVGQRTEYRFVSKGGGVRDVESQGSVILDVSGRTSKVVVISRDITERKLAEQALRESEQRYKRLVESTTDYVFNVQVEGGRIVAMAHGPGCVALTGCTAEEFAADQNLWYRMLHAEDRPAVLAQVEQILRGESPPALEHRIWRKDGRLCWIRNTVVPHRDEQGRLISYDGVVADITARKEAEQAVRESQERLELVIQGSSDGIWDWNVTTNEVYFSHRWKSMLGYEDHEIENNFLAWQRLLHDEDRERALATVDAYFRGKVQFYELEHRLRHKDGSYRWILARGVALRDAAGKPLRMAGSHVDVTERKLAEERLREANAGLARSEEALRTALEQLRSSHEELKAMQLQLIQAAKMEVVGTLAAGVAHEVKNPLQTILMGLAYLDSPQPAELADQHLVLAEMREAVNRADGIVRELLQLSAPTQLDFRRENLNDVIGRSIRLVHHQLAAGH